MFDNRRVVIALPAIKEPSLRELIGASIAVRVVIRGVGQGFLIVAYIGDQERVLERARGGVRLFASLDTAASFVHEIGLPRFTVDMSDYHPGRLRKARPDRAEALKRTRTRMQQPELEL